MNTRRFLVIGLLTAATPALAAGSADLTTSIAGPAGTTVYDTGRYTVTVSNVGNRTANSASVVIQLPETNTSPTVHVMGDLGAMSGSCVQAGTTLDCDLGRIRKGTSVTVFFDIALPESTDLLGFDATAYGDSSPGNNDDSYTANLDNVAISFSAPLSLTNEHCTGTGLTSFYECELYPSSITSHATTLEIGGTVSFAGNPAGYTGTWSSTSSEHLGFTYSYNGDVVAEFDGYGVSSNCWEGVTTFPGSSWVSPYSVCF